MLTVKQAARLRQRSRRRRADGTRGLLARRALRRLAGAICSDEQAAQALFEVWLDSLDDEAWQALAGCPARAAWALAAAVEPGRPAASRSAIGAFCAARGLAPDEPAARALWHVLTGQHAQHLAADPNGSTLAAAYQAATADTRAAVRESLAGAGDLDLVRIVAGTRGQRRAIALVSDDSWVRVRDARTLKPVAGLRGLGRAWGSHFWATHGGCRRALASGSFITVARHPLTEVVAPLADQPLALLSPADGPVIAQSLRASAAGPVRPLLEALGACAEHRFGSEVALGSPAPARAAADDMALAEAL
jgi:hypothetical protein